MPKHFRILVAVASAVAMFGLGACSHAKGLRITRIDPSTGLAGDTVTIYGQGFEAGGAKGVTVYFGNKKARVLSFQGDSKLLVSPPAEKLGKTVDVLVVFADARSLKYPKAFTYAKASEGFGVGELTGGKAALKKNGAGGGAMPASAPGAAAGAAKPGAAAPPAGGGGAAAGAAGAAKPGAAAPPAGGGGAAAGAAGVAKPGAAAPQGGGGAAAGAAGAAKAGAK